MSANSHNYDHEIEKYARSIEPEFQRTLKAFHFELSRLIVWVFIAGLVGVPSAFVVRKASVYLFPSALLIGTLSGHLLTGSILAVVVAIVALKILDKWQHHVVSSLYFFPDRILIYQGSEVGAVSYSNLSVQFQPVVFVEADGVPADSEVIGQTWQYVNKNGGPDRRFAHNPQIPTVRYGELTLQSPAGLNFVLQSSNVGRAAAFKSGLEAYSAG